MANQSAKDSMMAQLPIREMILYKHGVGYFVRAGKFTGETVTLEFLTDDINDVLKSLTVLDRAGGKVLGVNYQTAPTINYRNVNSSINLSETGSQLDLVRDLRGRMITCTLVMEETQLELTGRVIGIEKMDKGHTQHRMVIQTEDEQIHFFDLAMLQSIVIHDEKSRQDLGWFLDKSLNSKQRQRVSVRLTSGDHNLTLSYVAPSPTWRVSYRFVAEISDEATSGRGLLQGWGVFDNNFNEDLENVQVTFVAGQPISFIYDLYSATIPARPTVQDEARVIADAIEYHSTPAGLSMAMDQLEAPAPQASSALKRMDSGDRRQARFASAASEHGGLPNMHDRIRDRLQAEIATIPNKEQVRQRAEDIFNTILAEENIVLSRRERQMLMETTFAEVLGSDDHLMDLSIADMSAGVNVEASGEARGEFFQYTVTNPVSVKRGESSLIPILSDEIQYTKELLYNHDKLADHPVLALRFANTTALTLERGPITIVENSDYKGEAILSFSKPGETIFLAYAVELNVHIAKHCLTYNTTAGLNIEHQYIVLDNYEIHQCLYLIENTLPHDITLTIEENLPDNHTSYEAFDTPEPAVQTNKERRWSVNIKAHEQYRFVRKDRKKLSQRVYIRSLRYAQLDRYLEKKWLDQATYQALHDVLMHLDQIKQLQAELHTIAKERTKLFEAQKQVRENLSSLQANSDQEARLRERMLHKLEDTQDQLDTFEAREIELNQEIERLEAAIDEAIQNLN